MIGNGASPARDRLLRMAPVEVLFGVQLGGGTDINAALAYCEKQLENPTRPTSCSQKVISSGIYGFVRHPMYFGALFLVLATPLALGSWWALLLTPLSIPVLYFRITNEEKVLLRDLRGYAEYRAKIGGA